MEKDNFIPPLAEGSAGSRISVCQKDSCFYKQAGAAGVMGQSPFTSYC
ncbi:hypothetical protein Q0590_10620 [Rhodocytophaga aerolata]|uniref:Uncharacterized protein n=1 Tax=Rhodocytophaga aerolata TaxID=455078 RepID=A0ABT8R3N3_9BACT|nr:hypothetical protein [Rhodocytophaga aerolata]MDO1446707.1 hypothetical protein [Rhodocytophaga aerolata]